MEIRSTIRDQAITNWWRLQVEMDSKNANLSNVTHNILSIIPHGVEWRLVCQLGEIRFAEGSQQLTVWLIATWW